MRDSRLTTLILIAIAVAVFGVHMFTNGQYGFHRDELQTLGDAWHMEWGFVAYPPVTPFFGWLSLHLFGDSVAGARVFPALAQALVILLGGLMARELGGGRFAQILAALAVAVAPVSLAAGALLQYVAFDFLWWVLTAWLVLRLLRTSNERLWIAIGAAIGLGMMTKYSMIFLVAGMALGLLFTGHARYLKSRWLWLGVGLALLIFLPNAIWQIQHHFITLDFLKSIHARDVRIGRTKDFLPEQFWVAANIFTIPLWIAGLVFYIRRKPFRTMAFMYLVPLVILIAARGRGYYLAPAYPMLLAAGAVWEEEWLARLKPNASKAVATATFVLVIAGGVLVSPLVLPITPINSAWFNRSGDFREEVGWPDLALEVSRIYRSLTPQQRAQAGIFATNYGEAGAIDMYGRDFGLPKPFSWTNSYWLRGYPDPPPQTVIVLGLDREGADYFFQGCRLAGHNDNKYGVKNEESEDHPDIFLCGKLRQSWPDFWRNRRHFG